MSDVRSAGELVLAAILRPKLKRLWSFSIVWDATTEMRFGRRSVQWGLPGVQFAQEGPSAFKKYGALVPLSVSHLFPPPSGNAH